MTDGRSLYPCLAETTSRGFRNLSGNFRIQQGMQEPMPPHAKTVLLDYATLDEDALVAVVRSDDREAFRHIMQHFGRHLYRIARGVFNDDAEAEDVVQETFMRAYRQFDTFRGEAPLRTWLISILLNEARSRLRKRRVMVGLEQITSSTVDPYWDAHCRAGSGGTDPASLAARAQIHRLLKRAVAELPDSYRMVFVLREIEQCSVEETAVRLAIKPQTVKTRLHRARRLLRKSLDNTLGDMLADTFPFLGMRCAALSTVLMAWLAAEGAGESAGPARGSSVSTHASGMMRVERSEPSGHTLADGTLRYNASRPRSGRV